MPKVTHPGQHETAHRAPSRAGPRETVLALLRTASILQRFYARLIEPHGLTYQQYNVLRILREAGTRGLPTLAIRDQMVEQAPGITRLIDKLEDEGWARRERGSPDRRQVFCRITAGGLALLRRLDASISRADDAVLRMLSRREQQELIQLLDRVRAEHEGTTGADEESAAGARRPQRP